MPKTEVKVLVGEVLNAPSRKNTEMTRYYAAISKDAKGCLHFLAIVEERSCHVGESGLCSYRMSPEKRLRKAWMRRG